MTSIKFLECFLSFRHPLVRLSKSVESYFGPRADAAFCVSKAMKQDLEAEDGWIGAQRVTVLYDRAHEDFR
jgi:hypothetical protein